MIWNTEHTQTWHGDGPCSVGSWKMESVWCFMFVCVCGMRVYVCACLFVCLFDGMWLWCWDVVEMGNRGSCRERQNLPWDMKNFSHPWRKHTHACTKDTCAHSHIHVHSPLNTHLLLNRDSLEFAVGEYRCELWESWREKHKHAKIFKGMLRKVVYI